MLMQILIITLCKWALSVCDECYWKKDFEIPVYNNISHLARFYITSDMVVIVFIEYVEISLITTLVMRDFALHDMWPFCICDYL